MSLRVRGTDSMTSATDVRRAWRSHTPQAIICDSQVEKEVEGGSARPIPTMMRVWLDACRLEACVEAETRLVICNLQK